MQKTQTICLLVLATVALGFALFFLKTVLLPFVIALFIVVGCKPILEYLEKRRVPRLIAFGLTFLTGTILLAGLCYMIFLSVGALSNNMTAYQQRLETIVEWVDKTFADSDPGGDTEALPNDADPAKLEQSPDKDGSADVAVPSEGRGRLPEQNPSTEGIAMIDGQATPLPKKSSTVEYITDFASNNVQALLVNLAGSLSSLLSYGVLILIFVYFLLFGDSTHSSVRPPVVNRIEDQVRKFLLIKTVISLITGLIFGVILWIFGVPLAVVFGVLAFLLNYIPNIGPLVAILLPIPFLVLSSEISPLAGITCFVLISAVQFISGNVIETNMMGKSFDVSPVVLLLALMFFGLIWGIVGMFLATPLVSIAKIILEGTTQGKPVAELLAGRWGANGEQTG